MGTVVIATSEPAARTVALWLLAGFLGSFIFIRTSARLMRSPKVPWWPGSVTSGDLHIHHLVWGIILLLLCGFLGFATTPITPWTQILAVLFGIGAGFTLDEFALWLRLEDVYWAEQGRQSVQAVMIATVFAAFIVVGAVPFPKGSIDAVIPLVVIELRTHDGRTVLALRATTPATGAAPAGFESLRTARTPAGATIDWSMRSSGGCVNGSGQCRGKARRCR